MPSHMIKKAGMLGGVLLSATVASAAPVITIANEGSPTDSFGDTAPGYNAFLITLTADPGDAIGAVDAGGQSGDTNGLFGPFLQEWDLSGRTGTTTNPTPYESLANSTTPTGAYSTDSHFLLNTADSTQTTTVLAADSEDNNLVDPAGAPTDVSGSGGDDWGTGSFLTATFGIPPSALSNAVTLAYVVLPKNQTGTYSIAVQEVNAVTHLNDGGAVTLTGTIGTSVPEPGSLALIGLGGLGLLRRKRSV